MDVLANFLLLRWGWRMSAGEGRMVRWVIYVGSSLARSARDFARCCALFGRTSSRV